MAILKHKNTTRLRKHKREKEGRKKERKGKSRKIHNHQPWICDDTWLKWQLKVFICQRWGKRSGGLIHSRVQMEVPKHLLFKGEVLHYLLITFIRNESEGTWGVVESLWALPRQLPLMSVSLVWMWPSLGGGCVCKGGQFGHDLGGLSPRSASCQPQSPVCSLWWWEVHPLCLMQTWGLSLHTQKLTAFSLWAWKPGLSKAPRHPWKWSVCFES